MTSTGNTEQQMLRIPNGAHPTPTPTTRSSRRIPAVVYVGVLVVLAAVLIVGSQAMGWFKTSGRALTSTGERAVPSAGASTTDIKGWMTIQQVLDAYPVTKGALYARFAIPADTPTATSLSELKESEVGTLDVPTLRAWIDAGAPS